jgi:methionyl-tRNA formyltransferase
VQAGLGAAAAGLAGPESPSLAAGQLLVLRNRVLAGTGSGPVELGDVQADGKRRMSAADWARGLHAGSRALVLG